MYTIHWAIYWDSGCVCHDYCIYVAGLINAGCFLPQGGMSYNAVEYSYIVGYVLGSFILCISYMLCCPQGGPFVQGFLRIASLSGVITLL